MSELISIKEFAKRMNVSYDHIVHCISNGRIRASRIKNGRRRINWETESKNYSVKNGNKNFKEEIDENQLTESDKTSNSIYEARIKKEIYAANKAELEFNIMEGNLIPVELVKKEWRNICVTIRKSLLELPDRIAPLLTKETKQ